MKDSAVRQPAPTFRARISKVPLGIWTGAVGVIAITVNLLSAPEQWTSPWIILLALAHVWCLAAVTRRPLPTWAAFLLIYLAVAFVAELRITAFVFLAPVMAGLVAYRGHLAAAACGAALIAYAGSIDPLGGDYFPTDLVGPLVWVLLLVAAVLVGRTLHQKNRQHRELVDRWRTDVQQRRDALARSLHDSVATSLTSIVMRAEALNLRHDLDPDTGTELGHIADHARSSMSEVRGLLRVLSDDLVERPAESEPSLLEQLDDIAELLRAHGFQVDLHTDRPRRRLTADQLVAFRQIGKELSTNVLKYAEPDSRVQLRLEDVDGSLIVSFRNVIRTGRPASYLASGLGLPGLAQLAGGIGGTLSTDSDERHWRTTLTLHRR